MFCKNCGAQLNDSAKLCNNCGTAVEAPAAPQPQAAPQQTYTAQPIDNSRYEGLSTASLVMGILSILFGSSFFGIVFGAIARSKAKQYRRATGRYNGKARAGKIMGSFGLIVAVLVLIAIIIVVIIGAALGSELASAPSYYY